MHIRNIVTSLVLASSITVVPLMGAAQMTDAGSAFTRIHLAGKMSKNSQMMARISCFIFGGVEAQAHRELLAQSIADFELSRKALFYGDAELGIEAERSQRIRNALGEVGDSWQELSELVTAVAEGQEISPGLMAEIDLYSENLLDRTTALNTRIANVYGEEIKDVPLILTLTLDMAGRQVTRMERASKEACLIGTGINIAANSENLEQEIALFSATLDALIGGYPGLIMPAPTEQIRIELEALRANWAAPKAALVGLYRGEEIAVEDRQMMAAQLEGISENLTELIEDYEAYHMQN